MISSPNQEESILVERGIAPILWAAYLHKESGYLATRKSVVRTAKSLLEVEEDIPETVVVEAHLLLERMEYENQRTLDHILKSHDCNSVSELSLLGLNIGLAAARVREVGSTIGDFVVPEVDVAESFANELSDPFMDLFSVDRSSPSEMSCA